MTDLSDWLTVCEFYKRAMYNTSYVSESCIARAKLQSVVQVAIFSPVWIDQIVKMCKEIYYLLP